jgi:hypothetical protein
MKQGGRSPAVIGEVVGVSMKRKILGRIVR